MGCNQSGQVDLLIKQRVQVKDMPEDQICLKQFQDTKKLAQQKRSSEAQIVADKYFKNGWIQEAVAIYQKIIQANPNYKSQIQGFGNDNINSQNYDWDIYGWYNKKKLNQNIKASPYDALSLCYLLLNQTSKYKTDIKKGVLWYKKMIERQPQNYALWIGYGNILGFTLAYDQALKAYEKVLQIRPNFVYGWVCKAFIYTYDRVFPAKAIQCANKIFELTQQNCQAWIALALAQKDVDKKINILKSAYQKHPTYLKIINQLGLAYGKKGQHDSAISYYKKCLQICPEFVKLYNNIGFRLTQKKNYQQAKIWYFKGMQMDPEYRALFNNLTDYYDLLKVENEGIQQQLRNVDNISKKTLSIWFYNIAYGYYNKQSYQRSLYWFQRAAQLNPQHTGIFNQWGLALMDMGRNEQAIEKYKKAIQNDPQNNIAYYNSGIAHKALGKIQQAISMYKKAIQINPNYFRAFNNLGIIYKTFAQQSKNQQQIRQNYEQAIDYFQFSTQINSTYTLGLTNMAVCLVKIGKFRQAGNAFIKAKQVLPNDNTNLSEANKKFLNQQLSLFDKSKDKWMKTSSITDQQKQQLKKLIAQFQNKFKSIAIANKKIQVSQAKVFHPQIIQILKIINEDRFELDKIQQIFQFVQNIFHEDEQYFHIIPLLLIQKFTNDVFHKKKPIMQTQEKLRNIMKKISQTVGKKQSQINTYQIVNNIDVKLTQSIITKQQINLFKQSAYFDNYLSLYIQIAKINNQSKNSFTHFNLLVEQVRKKSSGLPGGIGMKIPIKESEQFKVMLRIMEKMFKKQIDKERTIKIIKNIDNNLKKLSQISLDIVVKEVIKGWTQQISTILVERSKSGVQTKFSISDLLRAKCTYTSLDSLLKGVRVCDSTCKAMGYEIIQLDNRLSKPQTQDIVFKIKINNAICQFQLALKQNQSLYHLDHCVYQILRSPLGCIFGSYLFMSKQVQYPLTVNCKDIVQKLSNSQDEQKKKVKQCAQYIFNSLRGQKKQ